MGSLTVATAVAVLPTCVELVAEVSQSKASSTEPSTSVVVDVAVASTLLTDDVAGAEVSGTVVEGTVLTDEELVVLLGPEAPQLMPF